MTEGACYVHKREFFVCDMTIFFNALKRMTISQATCFDKNQICMLLTDDFMSRNKQGKFLSQTVTLLIL
jgi:hypothetical protein